MKKIWLLVASVVVLAGCETVANLEPASDLRIDLRHKHTSFVLKKAVTIPARRTRLSFQDGGVVASRDPYQPFCILEVDPIDHQGFTVKPDSFDVARIQRSTVQIASQGANKLASASGLAFTSRKGGESRVHDGYHFWLESDSQPAVRRLTCYGFFERISRAKPPTLDEIAIALGETGLLDIQ